MLDKETVNYKSGNDIIYHPNQDTLRVLTNYSGTIGVNWDRPDTCLL